MRIGRAKGFTFVEMIVAIMIVAMLGVAVYTTFSQGVRLWTRTAKDRGEWKLDLWVEKITGDIRNSFWDAKVPFKGAPTEFSFATLARDPGDARREVFPVSLRYFFNPKRKVVEAQRTAFENVLVPRSASKNSALSLEKVVAFEVEYYGYDPKSKVYSWRSHWNKDCFPEAVKITIEPEQMSHRKWTRMISMPAENACPV
jgi:prepilin-type N-terminal cleavage/methylation domain-containing protein